MDKPVLDARIAQARTRLANNLGELQERMTRARETFSPSTYLSSPWLRVGAGVAIGLLVGRRRTPRLTAGGVAAPAASSGFVRAAIMAGVTSLARVVIERVVTDLARGAEADEEA